MFSKMIVILFFVVVSAAVELVMFYNFGFAGALFFPVVLALLFSKGN